MSTASTNESPLYWAVRSGDAKKVASLIADGAALIHKNAEPLLYLAIQTGDLPVINALIQGGADVNETFCNRSLLFWAACKDQPNIDVIDALLGAGAETNPIFSNARHVSYWLTPEGQRETQRAFDRSNVNYRHLNNTDPLIYIVLKDTNTDVLKALIAGGADVNLLSEGRRPLLEAIKQGNLAATVALIQGGADVNQVQNGTTPLFMAIFLADWRAVDALIAGGADVNLLKNGLRPLSKALNQGNQRIAEALLDAGAGVNPEDESSPSPLLLAASHAIESTNELSQVDSEDYNRPEYALVKKLILLGAKLSDNEGSGNESTLVQTVRRSITSDEIRAEYEKISTSAYDVLNKTSRSLGRPPSLLTICYARLAKDGVKLTASDVPKRLLDMGEPKTKAKAF